MAGSEFLAIVKLAVQGAQSARKDIESFRKTIMETGEAAGLSAKELDQLDKTISKGAASQKQATQASKQANTAKKQESAEAKKLREELERLNNQYKRTQEQLLTRGGDPSGAIGRFSQEELKRIVALNQVYPQYGREVARAAQEALRLAEAKQKLNQQMGEADTKTQNYGSSLPRLRYALYDVSQTAALMGAAMAGIGGAVLKTAVDYERSFADVIRTTGVTGDQVEILRAQFEDLNTELPVSFQELAEVGKLAGQLGIPVDDIQDFTRLVVQFSETTGISVEDSATAFGRLSALLGLTGSQFDNLGSSILAAGTSFVATEADIVSIATQLAGVGRQAGLTADQVVGLSTALASVGIAPELARGVITRTFGRIGQAVTAGGSSLTDFAKIAGMSADEFATAWREDASGAFLAFVQGIQARGSTAEAALASLGITSVRDVPALLRLAQTSESILAPALGVAAEGFAEGTELADQYGIIAGTTAEQLNRLQQNVQQLFAELSKGVLVFAPAIESISALVKGLREVAKIPIVGFLSSVITSGVALGGVFLLALGGAIRFSASLLAVRTSLKELNVVSEGQRVTLTNLVGASFRAATGNQKLAVSNNQLSIAVRSANVLLAAKARLLGLVSGQNAGLAASSRAAASGVLSLVGALKAKAGALGAVSTALKAVPMLLAIDVIFKMVTSFENLRQAVEGASNELIDFGLNASGAGNATDAVVQYTENLANAYREANGWLSQFSWWLNGLVGFTPLENVLMDIAAVREAGQGFINTLSLMVSEGRAVESLDMFSAMIAQLEAAGLNTEDFIAAVREVNPELVAAYEGAYGAVDALYAMDEAHAEAAFAALDQADQIAILRDEMFALVDDAYAVVNAEFAMEEALNRLGEAFARNGSEAEANGAILQSVIKLIIDQAAGDIPTAVANLEVLYQTLISNGMAYAHELVNLRNVIDSLLATSTGPLPAVVTPTINTTALSRSYSTARQEVQRTVQPSRSVARNTERSADAAERQTRAVRETQKEVRTLLDYGRDLASVFGRAFDLRFKAKADLDKIFDTWDNISESIADAEKNLADLQRNQQKLASDRAVKEYFLSIAEAYGDTLRADVLRGELADVDAEIVDNTKEIAQAQNGASRELEGNTAAARENRRTITDLVSQYQDYIVSLAESGMSQADLRIETEKAKREFIAQATQLGFAETQVLQYASAFDDMTFAINNVPRNVTIEADVNPALTALRELEAQQNRNIDRANDLNRALGSAAPSYTPPSTSGSVGGSRPLTAPLAENLTYVPALSSLGVNPNVKITPRNFDFNFNFGSGFKFDYSGFNWKYASYSSGGFTGRGGKFDPAGVVHKGEYVVPQEFVDQRTGLPSPAFLSAMQNGLRGYQNGGMVGGGSMMPDVMMVELSPYDRQLLEQAGNVQLRLDGRVVAQAANRNNVVSAQRGSN